MGTVRSHDVAGRALLACMLIGCEAFPDPPELNVGVHEAYTESDYISHQGRLLLGFKTPDVRRFSLASSQVLVTDNGELIVTDGGVTKRGQELQGRQFESWDATSNVPLKIAQVHAPDQGEPRWQYRIEELDGTPACDDTPPLLPHSSGDPLLAFAVPGWWQADGTYRNDTNQISFACRRGVVAKCIVWDYTPTHERDVVSGDMLQACTRMARADHCANGRAHTFDGTPIYRYHNAQALPQHPSPVAGFTFEAAWPPSARGLDGPIPQAAICLSKLRWSSLPLGGGCPSTLRDPRIDQTAHYCDGLTEAELRPPRVLVMVDSAYMDLGLYTWTDSMNNATFTTTALLPGSPREPPTWRPGAEGLAFPSPPVLRRFEGGLYNPDKRNPVSEALGAEMVRVKSFQCGADYVTTGMDLSSSCTQVFDDEGLAYPPYTPNRAKLRRWWDPMRGRSSTTSMSPTSMVAGGWQLRELIGGVVGAVSAVNLRWDSLGSTAEYSLDVQTKGGWIARCIGWRPTTAVTLSPRSPADPSICPDVSQTVTPAEIVAFQINYVVGSGGGSVQIPYDGTQSDVYIEIPGGTPTALTLSWNAQSPRLHYAVYLHVAGAWETCATDLHLANDNELVLPGSCPDAGAPFALTSADEALLCAAIDGNWKQSTCTTHPLDGNSRRVELSMPVIPLP